MRLVSVQVFLDVFDEGSVRKAAESANITPSAVSRHISALETQVGSALFVRRSSGMVPTEEGLILETHARRMAQNFDFVSNAIEEIRGQKRGVIRVSVIEAVATSLMHPTIAEFRKNHSNVRFEVEVVNKDNSMVAHSLLGYGADIGLMYKLNINSELEYVTEFPTPFAAVATPDHPLASLNRISMKDLIGQPVAALAPTSATRKLIDNVVRAAGLDINYTLTVNSFEMAKEFALTRKGVCLLPAIAVEREKQRGKLVAIPLTDQNLSGTRTAVCIQKGAHLSPSAAEFLSMLKNRIRSAA